MVPGARLSLKTEIDELKKRLDALEARPLMPVYIPTPFFVPQLPYITPANPYSQPWLNPPHWGSTACQSNSGGGMLS